MANFFSLGLALATLITGIVWCWHRFVLVPKQRAKQADAAAVMPTARGVESIASFFPILAVVFIVRSFIYEPFQIPSGSMMPTLLIGDFIVVEKFSYGIKEPITQRTLIPTGSPKRGDVAVFKYPLDQRLDYIKRVIGLPGDRVIYNTLSKQLTIYPNCHNANTCETQLPVTYGDVEQSPFVIVPSSDGRTARIEQRSINESTPTGLRLNQVEEQLGDVKHALLLTPRVYTRGTFLGQQLIEEFDVPAGHYFVMGDNRDNSADSRFWGFVPERNLVGRAVAIWMSFEKQEGDWLPSGVRLNRIGGIH